MLQAIGGEEEDIKDRGRKDEEEQINQGTFSVWLNAYSFVDYMVTQLRLLPMAR